MMTLHRALTRYELGQLTSTGLMLETLQLVSDQNVDSVLSSLPVEVLEVFKIFVEGHHSGVRVFNGPKPSEESLRTVTGWFAEHALLKSSP